MPHSSHKLQLAVDHPQHAAGRPRARRAQAMVEFALALPILLLVVYGLMEVARLIFTYSAVTTASREAVRYASAGGLISSNPAILTKNYQDCIGIRNTARKVAFGLNLPDNQIRIYWDGPSRVDASGNLAPVPITEYCSPGSGATSSLELLTGDRVWVNVSAQFTALLPLTPFNSRLISSGNTARTILGTINIAPTPTP